MKKLVPSDAVLIPDNAKCVFKGIIFNVYQWPQKLFDGSEAVFEMLRRPDTVTIIGVVDDKIIVLNDEQPHVGSRVSFPGGRVDEGENTLSAAQRETREETGHEFKTWRLIKVWQPHTKLEWFIYLYLATDGQNTDEQHTDAGEKIAVETYNFDEVKHKAITKSGYLGESKEVFEKISGLEELLNLPEFKGPEVDR